MKLTVEKFLKDGHLFQDWDCIEDEFGGDWFVGQVNSNGISIELEDANSPWTGDEKRFVAKARCLMLPKHFRLYQDVSDGTIAVVNKQTGKYQWAGKGTVNAVVGTLDNKSERGTPIHVLSTYKVKPIISFAQLKN